MKSALSFLFQSPEVKYPMELMAIPTCQMDPMLSHQLRLTGAIHTPHLLLVSLGTEDGDYSSYQGLKEEETQILHNLLDRIWYLVQLLFLSLILFAFGLYWLCAVARQKELSLSCCAICFPDRVLSRAPHGGWRHGLHAASTPALPGAHGTPPSQRSRPACHSRR